MTVSLLQRDYLNATVSLLERDYLNVTVSLLPRDYLKIEKRGYSGNTLECSAVANRHGDIQVTEDSNLKSPPAR